MKNRQAAQAEKDPSQESAQGLDLHLLGSHPFARPLTWKAVGRRFESHGGLGHHAAISASI